MKAKEATWTMTLEKYALIERCRRQEGISLLLGVVLQLLTTDQVAVSKVYPFESLQFLIHFLPPVISLAKN